MKGEFMAKVSRGFGKVAFAAKAHSPEILIGVGIVGVVTSTVLACKATLKVDEVLKEHEETMKKVREYPEGEEYTEKDRKKDTTKVYMKTGAKIAKLYAPAVIIGTLSIGCICGSHVILNKRNVALGAAYEAVDTAFKEYRGRVVEKFGAEVDEQLRYGMKEEKVTKTVVDDNGKEKKVADKVKVVEKPEGSKFARYITYRNNPNYENDDEFMRNFVKIRERNLTDKLRKSTCLTLNEAYRALDIPETQEGLVMGWIFDERHPTGDNFVEIKFEPVDILNEYGESERAYLVDFNVDDKNIFSEMGKREKKRKTA